MGKLARTDLRLIVMFTYSVSYEYAYFATAMLACLIRVIAPDLAGICHASHSWYNWRVTFQKYKNLGIWNTSHPNVLWKATGGFFNSLIFILHVCVNISIYVWTAYVCQVPLEARRGHLGTGFTGSCEPPHGCWEWNSAHAAHRWAVSPALSF